MKFDKVYTRKFLIITAITGFLVTLVKLTIQHSLVNSYLFYIFLYFAIITYVSHLITSIGHGKDAFEMQNYFMLGFTIRLLLSAVVLFLYFYIVKENAWSFLLNFFILYFVYTFFEIKSLLLSLQPHSKSGSEK